MASAPNEDDSQDHNLSYVCPEFVVIVEKVVRIGPGGVLLLNYSSLRW